MQEALLVLIGAVAGALVTYLGQRSNDKRRLQHQRGIERSHELETVFSEMICNASAILDQVQCLFGLRFHPRPDGDPEFQQILDRMERHQGSQRALIARTMVLRVGSVGLIAERQLATIGTALRVVIGDDLDADSKELEEWAWRWGRWDRLGLSFMWDEVEHARRGKDGTAVLQWIDRDAVVTALGIDLAEIFNSTGSSTGKRS